ncbi:hypothetical protein DNTS_003141 [Danionella cerebrum]|uniref:Uncharacterized protein n=1 Tax=Danionella cerebrum TaxID=2873325 RepID=A0A553NGL8_9TELE|nr:hypothetical protein DNTS_003141 [Danionella translucida]
MPLLLDFMGLNLNICKWEPLHFRTPQWKSGDLAHVLRLIKTAITYTACRRRATDISEIKTSEDESETSAGPVGISMASPTTLTHRTPSFVLHVIIHPRAAMLMN